ncbi:outer membrane receptor protein involved in Fe transport [Sphingobium sp. B1D7B]|uniref:TonB-dependent receptor domain-containing protein n=1 Tax=unclassified Sphingobium TaxID=2611147 RepID=UPI0022259A28|nr:MULTISPECIES: TonB-dependent receptor [unclassified Sphingobium]MCW2365613.1 outer membrane receptor protein involved in Fe transport [Sphingobium sp. B7D2B]MCW2393240.1 outer membrane receptor protein involved in Fe transport [Sphingobium sp. B11D3A]MCW2405122.1 outer membrane receptor protein involved in Fe transport [Sphingobium sp. B1D7B]
MSRRTWLLASAAACTFVALGSAPALAQDGPAPQAQDNDAQVRDIIITGSRVKRDGFQAPTPLVVVTSEAIAERGAANVGDYLNEVPSFRPSVSNQTNTQSSNLSGATFADLRALGNIRTLVLVDGRRHVPTVPTGQVDLNLMPTVLIDRIDVVTGGASAAYGSDAISGVVNVIMNNRLTGLKGDLSLGLSEEGDNFERRVGLAFGSPFADGRGHFTIGGEYVKSDGIGSFDDRAWGRRYEESVSFAANRPAGVPSRSFESGVRFVNSLIGGVILGNNADTNPANGVDALRGIWFPAPGQVGTFTYGNESGGSSYNMSSSQGTPPRLGHTLVLPIDRYVVRANLNYELSDSVGMFVEGSYGRSGSDYSGPMPRDTAVSGPRAVVIQRDNYFLPAQVATIMDANNITSFVMGRSNPDFSSTQIVNFNSTYRIVGGLNGNISGWNWDAYVQYGQNKLESQIRNMRIQQNFIWALDAIQLPNGQIVCRNTVARAQGCQPLNLFGAGAMSQEAINYVNGTQFQSITTSQFVGAANISGEPFSTWAGPVSLAVGGEYRRDSAESVVDSLAAAGAYNFSNPKPYEGAFTTKEAYAEVVVPLARDVPFFKSFDLNGAIRHTNYEVSGGVTTWKIGATWDVVDGVRLRTTRSRDIRAPNAAELFSVTSTQSTLRNPFNGVSRSYTVVFAPSETLAPEKANTFTVGAVFTPTFLPGFSASVDFYNIKIDGAIASFPAQQIIDNCYAEIQGGTPGAFCATTSLSGTGTSTEINSVTVQLLNLASLETRGVDFEMVYRFNAGPGRVTTRLFGTYVADLISDDGLGVAPTYNAAGIIQTRGSRIDRAGQLGGFTSGLNTGATSVPHWQLNASLGYETEKWGTTLNARWIDKGIVDATLVQPGDPDYNAASPISVGNMNVASRLYLNWTGNVTLMQRGDKKVQLYAVVNNLLNKEPPFPSTQVAGFYDRIGRAYKVGVRFAF